LVSDVILYSSHEDSGTPSALSLTTRDCGNSGKDNRSDRRLALKRCDMASPGSSGGFALNS